MRISDWSSDVCSSDLDRFGKSVFLATVLWFTLLHRRNELVRRQFQFLYGTSFGKGIAMRKLAIVMAFASTALATTAQARDGAWYVGVEGGGMIVEIGRAHV